MDREHIEADLAYRTIYARAEESVIVADDYVGLETLHLLKSCSRGVRITLLSDNVARPPLGPSDLEDFATETGCSVSSKGTENKVHDRCIVLDYGTPGEEAYLCESSNKDSGSKATMVLNLENPRLLHPLIDDLLGDSLVNSGGSTEN